MPYIAINSHGDSPRCACGNDVMADGFYPCDPATGAEVEPSTLGGWDAKSIVCAACGRIMDGSDVQPDPDSRDEFYTHRIRVTGGKCTYDSGSMTGNQPLCDARATKAIVYAVGSRPIAPLACDRHVRAQQNRAYPYDVSVEDL